MAQLGVNASSYALDASDETAVMEFFKQTGRFDHLVSTIKPAHLTAQFETSDTNNTRNAFEAKYWGQYYLARHCLKTIAADGSILLTSGIAASRGYCGFSGTAAMNGAVEALIRSLAVELAPRRVNAASPGFIERYADDTERLNVVTALGGRMPLQHLGTHTEAAEAYLYLLQNKYSSGTILAMDGGELCV